MKQDVKIIFGLSLAIAVGLFLNIFSCWLYGVWWPIFVVVAYFLAPLPNIFCMRCSVGYEENKSRAFMDAGYFMTGILVISGFALPTVLAHLEIMSTAALLMALAGGLIVYGSILLYVHCFYGRQSEDDAFS